MGKKYLWMLMVILIFGLTEVSLPATGFTEQVSPLEIVLTDSTDIWYSGTNVEGTTVHWDRTAIHRVTVVIANTQENAHELRQINLSVHKASLEQEFSYWELIPFGPPFLLNPKQYYQFTATVDGDWESFRAVYLNIDGEWIKKYFHELAKTLPIDWSNFHYHTYTAPATINYPTATIFIFGMVIILRKFRVKKQL